LGTGTVFLNIDYLIIDSLKNADSFRKETSLCVTQIGTTVELLRVWNYFCG